MQGLCNTKVFPLKNAWGQKLNKFQKLTKHCKKRRFFGNKD
jgi:hypothetical protein